MAIIQEIALALWNVWKEMFKALMNILPKVIAFTLWVISAIIILPCVFIAGEIYPMWVKWGEDM